MKDLLTYLAQNLVSSPDAVEVNETESPDGRLFTLKVGEGDVGRVIGRNGRTAKEIRTVMRAANRENRKVMVEFID
jgi:hypothetical protein